MPRVLAKKRHQTFQNIQVCCFNFFKSTNAIKFAKKNKRIPLDLPKITQKCSCYDGFLNIFENCNDMFN